MRRGSVRLKQRKLARAEQLISLLLNLYAIPSVPALGLKRDYNILMRGWLIMAMVGAALMTAPAVAQVRAAHSASARASHPFPARSAFVSHSLGFVPPVANRPLFFHHHRYFVRYSRGPYYPGYYGGYSYPLFWDSYSVPMPRAVRTTSKIISHSRKWISWALRSSAYRDRNPVAHRYSPQPSSFETEKRSRCKTMRLSERRCGSSTSGERERFFSQNWMFLLRKRSTKNVGAIFRYLSSV